MSGLLDSEKPRFFKTKVEAYAQHALEIVRSRVFVRIASVVVSFAVFLGLLIALIRVNPGNKLHTHLPENIEDYLGQIPRTPLGGCKELNITGNEEIVKAGLKKYQDLRDDKFTIAIQTYKRPEQLEKTLASLLEVDEEIPSLLEVVIVWNEIDAKPPSDFKSRHGVHVRYRVSEHNSLNSRLLPDPDFKTQAILLSDDDVFYEPLDLEFAFQAWRKYGRDSLTGAMARCTRLDEYGHWHYQFCRKGRDDHYNLMITNLAFSHIRFLDYYSSDDPVMTKIRAFVDDHMNCEDIAMNYVVTLLTGEPPLLVFGDHPFVNMNPPGGISHQRGHFETRSRCLDHFADLIGCLPLLNATAHLGLGSGRHKWDYGKNNGR